jgi:hypothetical protein
VRFFFLAKYSGFSFQYTYLLKLALTTFLIAVLLDTAFAAVNTTSNETRQSIAAAWSSIVFHAPLGSGDVESSAGPPSAVVAVAIIAAVAVAVVVAAVAALAVVAASVATVAVGESGGGALFPMCALILSTNLSLIFQLFSACFISTKDRDALNL